MNFCDVNCHELRQNLQIRKCLPLLLALLLLYFLFIIICFFIRGWPNRRLPKDAAYRWPSLVRRRSVSRMPRIISGSYAKAGSTSQWQARRKTEVSFLRIIFSILLLLCERFLVGVLEILCGCEMLLHLRSGPVVQITRITMTVKLLSYSQFEKLHRNVLKCEIRFKIGH